MKKLLTIICFIFLITTVYAATQDQVKAVSSTGSDIVSDSNDIAVARYWRPYVSTIGAGNTLTITATLQF